MVASMSQRLSTMGLKTEDIEGADDENPKQEVEEMEP